MENSRLYIDTFCLREFRYITFDSYTLTSNGKIYWNYKYPGIPTQGSGLKWAPGKDYFYRIGHGLKKRFKRKLKKEEIAWLYEVERNFRHCNKDLINGQF